ncbi:MAG: hypothetical protein ACFB21_14210 [Opitutales bacterium]
MANFFCGRLLLVTSLILVLFALLSPSALGRIGESQGELEARLLADRRAEIYDDDLMGPVMRGLPIGPVLNRVREGPAPGVQIKAYYKHARAEPVRQRDMDEDAERHGWDLIVIYYNGRSALEVYRRHQGPNEHEINGLLARQQGGSVWNRVGQHPHADQVPAPVLQAEYWREDDQVAAYRHRNYIVFYSPGFEALFRLAVARDEAEAEAEAQQRAPISVDGF